MRDALQACEDENAAISDEAAGGAACGVHLVPRLAAKRGVLVSSERLQPGQVTQSKAIAVTTG